MIIIGLTGSIGMGKSTTAKIFSEFDIPVHDSDAAVHELYKTDAVEPVGKAFPGSVEGGFVCRSKLAPMVWDNPSALQKLEAIIHPMVGLHRERFLNYHRTLGAKAVLVDIPLLFEKRNETQVDKIVVVSCHPDLQRQRVMARPGMTAAKFDAIIKRQLPDPEKREMADFVIDTGKGVDDARAQVEEILRALDLLD